MPSGYFNMTVPGANDSRYTKESAFGQALEEAFHVKIFAIEEEKPVTVLKWLGSGLPAGIKRSNPGEDKSKAVNYSIAEFKAYGINEFADWIESQWEQMPVIDETNLNDTYDFSLKCNTIMQPESIPKNVQELGIEVRTEKRKLRVVIVEPS